MSGLTYFTIFCITALTFEFLFEILSVIHKQNNTLQHFYHFKRSTNEHINKSVKSDRINISFQHTKFFAKRNITDLNYHLTKLSNGMKPYLLDVFTNNLSQIRHITLNNFTPVVNGYKENFIDQLEAFNVTTLFLKVTDDVLGNLQSPLLAYGSNNCKKIGYPNSYGSNCFNEAKIFDTNSVTYSQFNVGLPENFLIKHGNLNTVTFVHILSNAFVLKEGDVYVNGIKIVPQRCVQNLKYDGSISHRVKQFENKIFTIAQFWGNGYFHAVIEDLPRISPYIDFLRKYTDIKIHVYSKEKFIIDLLEKMGIFENRIIAGSVKGGIVYMPPGTACGRPATFNIQLLSMQLRAQIPYPPQERRSIVIIKRSSKRYFKNHQHIVEAIKNHVKGTNISVEIFPDKPLPSLSQTMAMFNRAFMVIGPHGAGESNLIFSEPGTVVIEGLCISNNKINLCYRDLMTSLGHHYYGVVPNNTCFEFTPQDLVPIVDSYIYKYYKGKH